MRTLLFALALMTSAAVAAQTESVVLTIERDGYTLSTVSDEPVEAEYAILLTHTEDGAWLSRRLSPADVPSRVQARRPARFRPSPAPPAPVTRRTSVTPRVTRIEARPQSRVRYTVWLSRLPAASVPSLLADLEDEAPFTRAGVQTRDDQSEVELSFAFPSVEAWAEWTERSGLEERFANVPSVQLRTAVEVVRPLARAHGEVIDEDVSEVELIEDID